MNLYRAGTLDLRRRDIHATGSTAHNLDLLWRNRRDFYSWIRKTWLWSGHPIILLLFVIFIPPVFRFYLLLGNRASALHGKETTTKLKIFFLSLEFNSFLRTLRNWRAMQCESWTPVTTEHFSSCSHILSSRQRPPYLFFRLLFSIFLFILDIATRFLIKCIVPSILRETTEEFEKRMTLFSLLSRFRQQLSYLTTI